jgi:hypothetical protein
MYDTVAESVFVEKLESGTRAGRQRRVAPAEALRSWTALGSMWRSSRVLAVDVAAKVEEYTTLSGACQAFAKSAVRSDCAARVDSVSQTAIASYMRRP